MLSSVESPIASLCESFDQPRQLPIRSREKRWLVAQTFHQLRTPYGTARVYETGPSQAPTVLLVHGWGGYAGMFSQLASELASRGYNVVTPDLLGHGENSEHRERHFEAQLNWLCQIMEKFGPCRHLIGHSLGGLLTTLLPPTKGLRSKTLICTPQSLTHAFQHFVDQLTLAAPVGLADKLALWYCIKHKLPADCLIHHSKMHAEHALYVHGRNDLRFDPTQAYVSHKLCPLPTDKKRLLIDEHLGHLGILYDTKTQLNICNFIDQSQE